MASTLSSSSSPTHTLKISSSSSSSSSSSLLLLLLQNGAPAKTLCRPFPSSSPAFRPLFLKAPQSHRRGSRSSAVVISYASSNGSFTDLASRFVESSRRSLESSWNRTVEFFEVQNIEEKMKRSFSAANQKFEEMTFDARRSAEDLDRRFRASERAKEVVDFASEQMKNVDQQFGLVQKFRNVSADFQRNWPTYRRQLNEFQQTSIGQTLITIFFLWFLLSGWFFQILFVSIWVLPFAAPFLINSLTKNMVIQGSCPSCKRPFVGIRSQTVTCNYCRSVVWQPRQDFSKVDSDPSIIDVDIE